MANNTGTSLGDFDRLLHQINGRATAPPAPTTLEQVAANCPAATNAEIRPTKESQVLPIPNMDMTIEELATLMAKYKMIMDRGYYLAVWTDLKATPVNSLNPVDEAKKSMSDSEKELYDWFSANGNRDEFEWTICTKDGNTPAGKQARFDQELMALRIMYRNDQITPGNLYWIRAEKPTHFQVVCAFTKIIKAANNIKQRATQGSGYDFQEYQTCNKIISLADQIVNKFMSEARKATKPISEVKEKIQARRHIVGKKCGITSVRRGGGDGASAACIDYGSERGSERSPEGET